MSHRFGRGSDHANGASPTLRSTAPKKPKVPRKSKSEKTAPVIDKTEKAPVAEKVEKAPAAAAPRLAAVPSKPADEKIRRVEEKAAEKASEGKRSDDRPRQDNGGAQIVSLDAFRKK
jgi:hypothetical protein